MQAASHQAGGRKPAAAPWHRPHPSAGRSFPSMAGSSPGAPPGSRRSTMAACSTTHSSSSCRPPPPALPPPALPFLPAGALPAEADTVRGAAPSCFRAPAQAGTRQWASSGQCRRPTDWRRRRQAARARATPARMGSTATSPPCLTRSGARSACSTRSLPGATRPTSAPTCGRAAQLQSSVSYRTATTRDHAAAAPQASPRPPSVPERSAPHTVGSPRLPARSSPWLRCTAIAISSGGRRLTALAHKPAASAVRPVTPSLPEPGSPAQLHLCERHFQHTACPPACSPSRAGGLPALPPASQSAPPGLCGPPGTGGAVQGASACSHAPLSRRRQRRRRRRRWRRRRRPRLQPRCRARCRGCCGSATMERWTRASSACLCSSSARPRPTLRATGAAPLCWPSRERCAGASFAAAFFFCSHRSGGLQAGAQCNGTQRCCLLSLRTHLCEPRFHACCPCSAGLAAGR